MGSHPVVIYEDENFLAVNKPSGLIVHRARISASKNKSAPAFAKAAPFAGVATEAESAGKSGEPALTDWLLEKYPEIREVGDPSTSSGQVNLRPGIVHRLDRGVSGVMVVAKNQKYFDYLKSLFQKRLVRKIYLALVMGRLVNKSGRIEKPIGVVNGTVRRSVSSEKMAKEAVTDYRLRRIFEVESGGRAADPLRRSASEASRQGKPQYFSLVEVEPKTGRTHQIRVHLASIGHPIVGDKLYGPRREPEWAERIMLHSLSIEFSLAGGPASPQSRERDEGGRRFRAEAEPPADYEKVIKLLLSGGLNPIRDLTHPS